MQTIVNGADAEHFATRSSTSNGPHNGTSRRSTCANGFLNQLMTVVDFVCFSLLKLFNQPRHGQHNACRYTVPFDTQDTRISRTLTAPLRSTATTSIASEAKSGILFWYCPRQIMN